MTPGSVRAAQAEATAEAAAHAATASLAAGSSAAAAHAASKAKWAPMYEAHRWASVAPPPPDPSDVPMHRAISMAKLVLRSSADLSSAEVHEISPLRAGDTLLVMQEVQMADGRVRSQVAKESHPRGMRIDTLGWVTSLKPTTGRTLERIADDTSAEDAMRRSRSPRRSRSSSPTGSARRCPATLQGAHALRDRELAEKHYRTADAKEEAVFSTLEERIGWLLVVLNASDAALMAEFDTVSADGSGDAELSPLEFRALVRGLGAAHPRTASISQRLLQSEILTPDDTIDQFYQTLDVDGSGALKVTELSVTLSKLKGTHNRTKYVDGASKIEALRVAGAAFDDATSAATAYEKAVAALEELRGSVTVSARLGDLLVSRSINVNDLRTRWDADGNGKLNRDECARSCQRPTRTQHTLVLAPSFAYALPQPLFPAHDVSERPASAPVHRFDTNIRGLGFEATDDELTELFASFDKDHSQHAGAHTFAPSRTQITQPRPRGDCCRLFS